MPSTTDYRWPRDLSLYTLWDFFPAAFNCPHTVERIGNLGVGGKWVCGLDRLVDKKDCIVYSFGGRIVCFWPMQLCVRLTCMGLGNLLR